MTRTRSFLVVIALLLFVFPGLMAYLANEKYKDNINKKSTCILNIDKVLPNRSFEAEHLSQQLLQICELLNK